MSAPGPARQTLRETPTQQRRREDQVLDAALLAAARRDFQPTTQVVRGVAAALRAINMETNEYGETVLEERERMLAEDWPGQVWAERLPAADADQLINALSNLFKCLNDANDENNAACGLRQCDLLLASIDGMTAADVHAGQAERWQRDAGSLLAQDLPGVAVRWLEAARSEHARLDAKVTAKRAARGGTPPPEVFTAVEQHTEPPPAPRRALITNLRR